MELLSAETLILRAVRQTIRLQALPEPELTVISVRREERAAVVKFNTQSSFTSKLDCS